MGNRKVVVLNKLCKDGKLVSYRLGLVRDSISFPLLVNVCDTSICDVFVDVSVEYIYDILKIVGKESILQGVIIEDNKGLFPVDKGAYVMSIKNQYEADSFLRKYYISSVDDILAIERSVVKKHQCFCNEVGI